MDWKKEIKTLLWIVVTFVFLYYMPIGSKRFDNAIMEAFHLVKWYAREHVLLCLVPAFFIAGAIGVFVSQESVMKYLGPKSDKWLAYGVASISGTILAVCSCTVLPLFSGIYTMGAGLGPATAFLYSGPAINVLAIILTARILGLELGIARAVGAIVFAVIIGLLMHFIFRHEKMEEEGPVLVEGSKAGRPLWQTAIYFALMIAILVLANWGKPAVESGFWHSVYTLKWTLTAASALGLAVVLGLWFKISWLRLALAAAPAILLGLFTPASPVLIFAAGSIGLAVITAMDKGEAGEWFAASWGFAKQILPLLLIGVFIAGALLGRVGQEGLIPSAWVSQAVGGNSLFANFFASIAGAFMYFATLTEVPILQGLIGSGMGKGPALALLLAGPALSLPSMLVLRSVMGGKKTLAFVTLVVIMATITGLLFGWLF
ncbi:MAG: putative permease [bacterium ADurb.Bin478]|nr:MAG: putative permease [bacterium ADurb.Bin478]HNY90612.1 permease [bacterium]